MNKEFPSVCVLFDAVELQGFSAWNYERLKKELEDVCDVFAVLHDKNSEEDAVRWNNDSLILSNRAIFAGTMHSKDVSKGLIPGNCDLKFIRAAAEFSSFRLIIWHEYDVFCTADVKETFRKLINYSEDLDFVGSYISKYAADGWVWWESLSLPPSMREAPYDVATRSFFPLFVASQQLVSEYKSILSQGIKGHSEVTMPTCARVRQLKMGDLSKTKENFTSYPQFNVDRPTALEINLPLFVHPVKSFQMLDAVVRIIESVNKAK